MVTECVEIFEGLFRRILDTHPDGYTLSSPYYSGLIVTSFHGIHRLTLKATYATLETISCGDDWFLKALDYKQNNLVSPLVQDTFALKNGFGFDFSLPEDDPFDFEYISETGKLNSDAFLQFKKDILSLSLPVGPVEAQEGRDGAGLLADYQSESQVHNQFSLWTVDDSQALNGRQYFEYLFKIGFLADFKSAEKNIISNCLKYL